MKPYFFSLSPSRDLTLLGTRGTPRISVWLLGCLVAMLQIVIKICHLNFCVLQVTCTMYLMPAPSQVSLVLHIKKLKSFWLKLKALCHAISADCLLIEAARAHAVNEHWAWRMADKFACTFKSAR